MQTMIIKGAEDKLTVPVEEVNIDDNVFMSVEYNVKSIPTLVLLDDSGKEIKRHTGVLKETELLSWLQL
jgi:thioredoxin-like negative regulator of GroEL